MNLVITQSPYCTLGFTPGISHAMGLDKYVMAYIHHYNIIKNIFTALKIPVLCRFISPSPSWGGQAGRIRRKKPRAKQTGTKTRVIKTSARLLRANPERSLPSVSVVLVTAWWTGDRPYNLRFFHTYKILLLP